jgi:hypothetical protein
MPTPSHGAGAIAPPASLCARNPLAWLTVFGPGAIIASLTIGTGELIFSSRGGAIFGYRVLFLFAVICLLKWALVVPLARHMVLTGAHPFRRWMELPLGPAGWLPLLLFLLAIVCIPIWLSFHATVLGNLLAHVSHTAHWWNGTAERIWGGGVLAGVLLLALGGGYRALERVQLVIVAALLLAAGVALVLFQPDWLGLAAGLLLPQELSFPAWLLADPRPAYQQIAREPVWVEATLYVGVIGGASYDYLAYTSFLRDKGWGLAADGPLPDTGLDEIAADPNHPVRLWLRAPLVDCTLSFLVVLLFSAVFVASGATVLAPARQIPGDENFLQHQAQFVTRLHPWLHPLYVAGALLAMLGTLYGTLEIAPTILREMRQAAVPAAAGSQRASWRRYALYWCAGCALLILLLSVVLQLARGRETPWGLTQLLIPANLFTGVLSCGLICLLNPWMDARFLPRTLRMPAAVWLLNVLAGIVFLLLGIKGYWDQGGWLALGMLAATVTAAWLIAWAFPQMGQRHV